MFNKNYVTMKTTLLFVLALMIGFSSMAQTKPANFQKSMKQAIRHFPSTNPVEKTVLPGTTHKPVATPKATSSVSKIAIGSSMNAYSVIVPETRGLVYDKDANLLMATHRGDHVTPGFGHGNDAVTVFSNDMGATWVEKIGFLGTLNVSMCRYPSGVLYNPAGNTDINNVYSVVAGPATNSAGWSKTYYGSRTYDDQNINQQFNTMSANLELIRQGMYTCDNGITGLGTNDATFNSGNTEIINLKGYYSRGIFNTSTNAFDYTYDSWNPKQYLYYEVATTVPHDTSWRTWSASMGMCFSKDGSIGYRWTDGIDTRAVNGSSFYPIINKTTDGGVTWTPLDYYDFGTPDEVYANLIDLDAQPGRVAPWFRNIDGVVDYKGNLHLVAECVSAVSLSKTPDSLTYIWTNDWGNMFEFEYDHEANTWQGYWCDSLRTDDPTSLATGNSIYGTGAARQGWDKRIHASISPDGKKVFATWTDTDDYVFWGLDEALNMYPDLKVWGRDLETNLHTNAVNETYDNMLGEAWGECYFNYVSPVSIDGDGYTEIPATIVDISTNGYDPDLPIFHSYLKGITVNDTDFIHGCPFPPMISFDGTVLSSNYTHGNQWYLDGVAIPAENGGTSQTYTPVYMGVYTCTSTSADDCTSDLSNEVTVGSLVGINTLENVQKVDIYPNPSNGHFTLSISTSVKKAFDVKVVNSLGVSIYSLNDLHVDGSVNKIIDLQNTPNGIYSVVLSDKNNQVIRKLVIR
jgi:hypothetical protein